MIPAIPSALDGLRVVVHENYVTHGSKLCIECRGDGELTNEAISVGSFDDSQEQQAELFRMVPIAQAICRYVNAGGVIRKLPGQMAEIMTAIADINYEVPGGWELLFTQQSVEVPVHAFVQPGTDIGLLVIEDDFADVMPVSLMAEQVEYVESE